MTKFFTKNFVDLFTFHADFTGILNTLSLVLMLLIVVIIYYGLSIEIAFILTVILVIIMAIGTYFLSEDFQDEVFNLETKVDPNTFEYSLPCKKPTVDNPFGNPNLTDFNVKQKTGGICEDQETTEFQNNVLHNNIFMNSNDYVWKRNRESMWNTVPGDTVPNDQMAFANWCYNDNNNCKAGNVFLDNPELASDYLCNCTPDLTEPEIRAHSKADVNFGLDTY